MADTPPPIELQAPDIGRWKEGGSGVDWVHVFDSGRPGPAVMVQALTHGNEICGAIAVVCAIVSGRSTPAGGASARRSRPERGNARHGWSAT